RWLTAAREACRTLADGVQASLREGATAAVIGGECTVIAGALGGALSAEPELSLVYCDAHGDFNTLATTPSHYIAGMVLAHLLGRRCSGILAVRVRRPRRSRAPSCGAVGGCGRRRLGTRRGPGLSVAPESHGDLAAMLPLVLEHAPDHAVRRDL